MTNTIFFETLRDDESCMSSCPSSRFSEVEELPRYSAFNEALLALKRKIRSSYRPPLPPQARRIGENEVTNSAEEHVNSSTPLDSNLKRFNLFELEVATMNFHPSNVLRKGSNESFRSIRPVWLVSTNSMIHSHALASTELQMGSAVAVKMLPNGNQDNAVWLSKIKNLGTFDHPNLVKVVGYCLERERRLLVSEFILGTSLEDHLSSRSSGLLPLTWSQRMKIAIGIARGVAYLHNTSPPIFHGNIKPSNILLDLNYNVKLSDFGLIKDHPVYPKVEGIRGLMRAHSMSAYSAPESVRRGELTTETDVYCFGVVLLELLLGQVAEKNGWMTVQFHNLKRAGFPSEGLVSCIDSQVEGAERAVGLVSLCLQYDDVHRPSMNYVVKTLEKHFDKIK